MRGAVDGINPASCSEGSCFRSGKVFGCYSGFPYSLHKNSRTVPQTRPQTFIPTFFPTYSVIILWIGAKWFELLAALLNRIQINVLFISKSPRRECSVDSTLKVTLNSRSINNYNQPQFPPSIFMCFFTKWIYEGWNFNSGNYLFTTDTK